MTYKKIREITLFIGILSLSALLGGCDTYAANSTSNNVAESDYIELAAIRVRTIVGSPIRSLFIDEDGCLFA